MASHNRQRKTLLEDPSLFSDQEIAEMVRTGVASLYEVSKSGGIGPFRKKRIEELLANPAVSPRSDQGYSQPTPPPFPGVTRPRFPIPRREERPRGRIKMPPPLPPYHEDSFTDYPPTFPGYPGPGRNLPPNFGNRY